MEPTPFLPDLPGLLLEQVISGDDALTFVARLTTPAPPCPSCGQLASRIHSRSRRTVRDLPISGRPVRLSFQIRRFFCMTPTCPRTTFAERLSALALPHAQRTLRLREVLRLIGFVLGGQAGARLVTRLGMPSSPDTLLRLVCQTALPPTPTPRVLGVDDWSFRKGRTFGTILVDLERHRPVDLLASPGGVDPHSLAPHPSRGRNRESGPQHDLCGGDPPGSAPSPAGGR